jgi:hypothetical protein
LSLAAGPIRSIEIEETCPVNIWPVCLYPFGLFKDRPNINGTQSVAIEWSCLSCLASVLLLIRKQRRGQTGQDRQDRSQALSLNGRETEIPNRRPIKDSLLRLAQREFLY